MTGFSKSEQEAIIRRMKQLGMAECQRLYGIPHSTFKHVMDGDVKWHGVKHPTDARFRSVVSDCLQDGNQIQADGCECGGSDRAESRGGNAAEQNAVEILKSIICDMVTGITSIREAVKLYAVVSGAVTGGGDD